MIQANWQILEPFYATTTISTNSRLKSEENRWQNWQNCSSCQKWLALLKLALSKKCLTPFQYIILAMHGFFFCLSNGNLNIFDMMEKISVLIEIRTRVQGGRKLRKALVRSKKIWLRSRSRSAGEIALTFAFALTLKRFERRSILRSF